MEENVVEVKPTFKEKAKATIKKVWPWVLGGVVVVGGAIVTAMLVGKNNEQTSEEVELNGDTATELYLPESENTESVEG